MIPDLAIYTHRWSGWQVRCAESIFDHTKRSFNLILVCEPGSCHQNMNRALRRSTSRYLCLIDEDVCIHQDHWLDVLLDTLATKPKAAVVGCPDVKEFDDLGHALLMAQPDASIEEVRWLPAHVLMFDREKIPDLCFDEAIPGQMCMTDLDACLQATSRGLKVYRDNRTVVYHPMRNDPETRRAEQRPTCEEQERWFPEQLVYMEKKWGELFRQSGRSP